MRQANWNNITWGYQNRQMAHIKSIRLSQSVKTEEQESNSGTKKTVVKSIEPEELTISYKAGFAVGLDPRGEFDMLKKCAGMQDNFVLGGKILGTHPFELDQIDLSNTILDDNGRILAGDLTLTFTSDKNESSKGGKSSKGKSSKATKTGSLSLTPADYEKARQLAKK